MILLATLHARVDFDRLDCYSLIGSAVDRLLSCGQSCRTGFRAANQRRRCVPSGRMQRVNICPSLMWRRVFGYFSSLFPDTLWCIYLSPRLSFGGFWGTAAACHARVPSWVYVRRARWKTCARMSQGFVFVAIRAVCVSNRQREVYCQGDILTFIWTETELCSTASHK